MYYNKIFIFIIPLLLSSCASAPMQKFVRSGPSFEQAMSSVKSVAIINDACIMMNATSLGRMKGDPYFTIEETMSIETFMMDGAQHYLEKKGYRVDITFSPFVCACKEQSMMYKVADSKDGEISMRHSPFHVSPSLANDEEYRKSLIKVLRQIKPSIHQLLKTPNTSESRFIVGDGIQENLKIISNRTNHKIVLFIIGEGPYVSLGMRLTPLGYAGAYIDTWVALVDTATAEILWSNALRIAKDVATIRPFFVHNWANRVLYHIPQKK
jgi:hypothetical protein